MPRITTKKSNIELRREYKLRFFTMLFLFVILAIVFTILFMLPSYTLLGFYEKSYKQNGQSDEVTKIQQLNYQYDQKLTGVFELSSEVVRQEINYLQAIQILREYAGDSVLFNSLEITSQDKTLNITVRGYAVNRESLLSFEKQVQSDQRFTGFQIPIEALTRQQDISFNVSFEYHEK